MPPLPAATADTICVLIADSNRMQAQLLSNALRRRSEFRLAICGMDTASIQNAIAAVRPQVALLSPNFSLNFAESMATVRRLHLAHPEIMKIVLLESSEPETVMSAFRSGARGLFCPSEANLRLLRKCIHSVANGQIWANAEQMSHVFDRIADVPSLRLLNSRGDRLLSPREEQVVALVTGGLANREIALELTLSEHTVKKYLFHIFDKLGVSTRVELALYAVNHGDPRQAGWIPAEPAALRPAIT